MKDMMLKLWVKTECAVTDQVRKTVQRFRRDESGAGVAEYAMVVGLAVIIGVVALRAFWGQIGEVFTKIAEVINTEILGK